MINKIPNVIWDTPINSASDNFFTGTMNLNQCFKIMHGKTKKPDSMDDVKERLIFEEFFINQIKIESRRKFLKEKKISSY